MTTKHITLEQFIDILNHLDRMISIEETSIFNCCPRQIRPDTFLFEFNGHMTGVLKFYDDGRVMDIQDMNTNKSIYDQPGHSKTFESMDAFLNWTAIIWKECSHDMN